MESNSYRCFDLTYLFKQIDLSSLFLLFDHHDCVVFPTMSSARSSSDSDDGLLKALSADSATGGSGASGCGFCGGCCALQRSRSGHEVVTYKAHTAGTTETRWIRRFWGEGTGDMKMRSLI